MGLESHSSNDTDFRVAHFLLFPKFKLGTKGKLF